MKSLRSVTVDCVSGEERYGYKKRVERNNRNAAESYVYVCLIDVLDFRRHKFNIHYLLLLLFIVSVTVVPSEVCHNYLCTCDSVQRDVTRS